MNVQQTIVERDRRAPAWQEDFLTHLLPRVKSHARFKFRNLSPCEREEAEAEAVAVAIVFFVRLVERGRNPKAFALRIAQIAVLRVRSGRLLGTGGRSQDVLSRRARQRRGFTVESLDSAETRARGGWQQILVEDRNSTPAEVAASRLDFREWLGRMHRRRREIAETLAEGYRTDEVAQKFRLSRARISQLRREFEDSWKEFQRELPRNSLQVDPAAT